MGSPAPARRCPGCGQGRARGGSCSSCGQQFLAIVAPKKASRRSPEWEMARARRSLPPGWTVGIARAACALRVTRPLNEDGGGTAYTFTAHDANDAIRVARDIDAGRIPEIQPGPPVPARRLRERW